MKLLTAVCLLLSAPGLILAQSSSNNSNATTDTSITSQEVKALQEGLAEQKQRTEEQQREIESLRRQLLKVTNASAKSEDSTPRVLDAVMHTSTPEAAQPSQNTQDAVQSESRGEKSSPLSVRIGGAEFTPGGFVDFTTVFRTSNLGSGIGTNFGAVPFNNTIQHYLSETRLSAQNSRFSLKATDKFGATDVTGYLEMDFLGNDAANVFVTSNSHTARMRLFWVDVKRGKWEVLGGQSWSWLTPNRVGLSPNPSDLFITQNEDTNYQVGLTWTRAAQFRVAYHPDEHWAMGVALENPQQYVGAGEVIYPFTYNALLGVQLDAANNTGTPNLHPDVIAKAAYDNDWNGKHVHLEAAGLLTSVRIAYIPAGTFSFTHSTKTGGGISVAGNVEVVKNVRVMANTFFSDGGGRYVYGLGPDAVIRPDATGTTLDPSLVHSWSGILGVEAQATSKTLFSAYYGGAAFQRNYFQDPTSPLVTKPYIGFGGPNSPNSANRTIQEGTFDWTQILWKSPMHGSLQTISQISYVTRTPWFIPAGAPKNAHLTMAYVSLRYVLP